MGLGDKIGSLRAGKAADLVAVDFSAPELAPCYDPVSHLVYAAGREHVSHAWVGGELLLDERAFVRKAFARLDTRWQLWQNSLKPLADS
jgi:5-methylthioadenosine/S-adenosylhomocysteine deaminase